MKKTILLLLFMSVSFASSSLAEEVRQGRITGKLMLNDSSPMSDGAVLIYDANGPMPLPEKYFRVPDNIALVDEDGKFSVEIAPGTYYLGGMKKKTGQGPSPLKEGDYFFISEEAGGVPKAYVVSENKTLDVGTISGAVPYRGILVREGVTAIEGIILNKKGDPVEGVAVFADIKTATNRVISFVSNWTGKDGKYFLRVHEGGEYNLNANDFSDPMRVYSLESKEPVSVKTGEVLMGINMKAVE